jgi:large subunit ribosomal protein L19
MTEIKTEEIKPGMHVKIFQVIKDGDKEKMQNIEGLVIAKKHGKELGATITLRRIMDGVGVEWILPIFSPKIKKIELIKAARVRRSKLYFLRDKSQKQIRAKLKKEIK